jgi:hypothetical protein
MVAQLMPQYLLEIWYCYTTGNDLDDDFVPCNLKLILQIKEDLGAFDTSYLCVVPFLKIGLLLPIG